MTPPYYRVQLQGSQRPFWLRVDIENETFLTGVEVNRFGDDVRPRVKKGEPQADRRLHVIDQSVITSKTPGFMHVFYGELEAEDVYA